MSMSSLPFFAIVMQPVSSDTTTTMASDTSLIPRAARWRVNLSVLAPNMNGGEQESKQMIKTINAICDSCAILSKERIGALMVLEKETKLGDIISTGTTIDSQPSAPARC